MNNIDPQITIGKSIILLDEVDSTNNYAMSLIHDGKAEHGMAILALCQTQGKGQRGKAWHTGKNNNLALTVVLKPNLFSLQNAFYFHCYICCSVIGYLNKLQEGFMVKWPNDIFYQNKKIGGILIENQIQGKCWNSSVVGIGLNINEANISETITTAISLQQITNFNYDIIEIGKGILKELDTKWKMIEDNVSAFYTNYLQQLYKKGETIRLKKENIIYNTILQTVNSNGQLICGEHEEHTFNFGEVEWILE